MTTFSDSLAARFERHRPRLFGIAYRMLGTYHDAEDVVQETFLRFQGAGEVDSDEAWLVSVVTRLAIDRLRRAATEREAYVGGWLPEPIAAAPEADPARTAELASELSIAFLVLLERLAPEERAAFLLREVFDADYAEIARVLGKSEAACRQVVHRARERVRREERRFAPPVDARERLLGRFVEALTNEDREGLLSLLAGDAVLMSDGGGKAASIPQPVTGGEMIADLLLKWQRMGAGLVTHRIEWLNGEPALLSLIDGLTVFTTSLASDGERITGVYRVLNPDKLWHVGPEPFLARHPGATLREWKARR